MNTLIIFIIALALAMDCFSVAISNSAVSGLVKPGSPLKVAIAFSFAHLVFIFAGYWLGLALQTMFSGLESWVAFVVLGVIGIKTIMETRKRHPKSKVFDINKASVIVVLSLATAMDAFLSGLALGINNMGVYRAGLTVFFIVFVFSLAGMAGGDQLGIRFARQASFFGGAFMLLAAVVFFSRLLG